MKTLCITFLLDQIRVVCKCQEEEFVFHTPVFLYKNLLEQYSMIDKIFILANLYNFMYKG